MINDFFKWLETQSEIVSSIVWGPTTVGFIIFVGIFFSVRLKFFQLFKVNFWMKNTFGTLFRKNKQSHDIGITPVQAMSTALAGAIGTGNIVGVATAITLGGPGAVFWMWVTAFLGMITIFAENILGVMYRVKGSGNQWVGGPMYYMKIGLHSKFLSIAFSISCIFATFGIGNLTQANSISNALRDSFCIKPCFTGITLAFISGIIIFGGVKRIAQFTEKIVPFMAFFYIVGGIIILVVNFKNVPKAFCQIFCGAFSFRSVTSGISGLTISRAIKYGISRGVFTNEAGLGSSPIIHASAETKAPIEQGMWGIFQVFIDTFVVCSITALCILSTGVISTNKDGISLSVAAFENVFGQFGGIFICLSTVMFAFATVISWSYYGEKSLEFLSGTKWISVYRSIYIVLIMFGVSMNLKLVWSLSDIFNAFMCIPNLIAILLLSNKIVENVKISRQNI